jgi:hypothetical protein
MKLKNYHVLPANDNDVIPAVFVKLKVAWPGQDSGKYGFLRSLLSEAPGPIVRKLESVLKIPGYFW